jgi:chromate transport protein ChrA
VPQKIGINDIQESSAKRLREMALIFLRLGTTAFGGPAAPIPMMEQEFVRRRPAICFQVPASGDMK